MSQIPALVVFALTAGATGAALSGCGTPACHWSSLSAVTLKTRLAMLRAIAPSRRRTRLAAVGLAALLGAGALTAYAAQPSAPERLEAEAAGVVGSGDQLALRVVEDSKERTVRPSEVYADGWKIDALTPTSATLVKAGERREVGLNPTGAVAVAANADQSRVDLAGDTLEAREATEKSILTEYWTASGRSDRSISFDDMPRVLGEARFQQFLENDRRLGQLRKARGRADALAAGDLNRVRAYDHLPVVGPDTFSVPRGMTIEEGAQAVGLSSSFGYTLDITTPRGQSGAVMVKCFSPGMPEGVRAVCELI